MNPEQCIIKENFLGATTPGCLQIEEHSGLSHIHSSSQENGYVLNCADVGYWLITPELSAFQLEMEFALTGACQPFASWNLFFHYQRGERTGRKVEFFWYPEQKLLTVKHEGETIWSGEIDLPTSLQLTVANGNCRLSMAGLELTFACGESKGGIGFSRNSFGGFFVLRSLKLSTDELPPRQPVISGSAPIPLQNGGAIPYQLAWSLEKFSDRDLWLVKLSLSGGAPSRSINPNANYCQYSIEIDSFHNASFLIGDRKYRIKGKQFYTLDANIQQPVLQQFLAPVDLPLERMVVIDKLPESLTVGFTYDKLIAKGYRYQSGSGEFRFYLDGQTAYAGAIPDEFSGRVVSAPNKKITELLPPDLPDYGDALKFAADNHYFLKGEAIQMQFIPDRENSGYRHIEAELENVFGDFMQSLTMDEQNAVTIPELPVGVYHLVHKIFKGKEEKRRIRTAFEVIAADSPAPPLCSGLPFLYSTPNEERFLERDAFDPWVPQESVNAPHYFSCSSYTPSVGTRKQVWRAIAPYRREWFMWLERRTEADWHYWNFTEAISNVDYLKYQLSDGVHARYNLWSLKSCRPKTYLLPEVQKALLSFLEENPELAAKMQLVTPEYIRSLDEGKGILFSEEAVMELSNVAGAEWTAHYSRHLEHDLLAQNDEFKKLNPKIRRSHYGPWSIYIAPYKAAGFLPWVGYHHDCALDQIYEGFWQFEDYPYSCAYQSWRGAWCLMNVKLLAPKVKVYPELYGGANCPGGCIDGAVALAWPPYAKCDIPIYFNLTQAYQYVYGTPQLTENGFQYWRDFGFMMRDAEPDHIDYFIRGWKMVHEYAPHKPLNTPCFLIDIDQHETRQRPNEILYNRSEDGLGYLYGVAAESGLPAGFAARSNCLPSASETKLLILPSVSAMSAEAVAKIRSLYNEGVSLFAVGNVDGLEDLFGVRKCPRTIHINRIDDEYIAPSDAELLYETDGAEAVLPDILFRHGRTALLNAPVAELGCDTFLERAQYGQANISKSLARHCGNILHDLTNAEFEVITPNCGIVVFLDKKDRTVLLLTDFSAYGTDPSEAREIEVRCSSGIDARGTHPVNPLCTGNRMDGFTVKLRPHESALIEIVKEV